MLIIWDHKVITIINKYMMMDYLCIILRTRIRVIDPRGGKLHRSLDGDWLFLSLVCIVSQWDGSLLNRLNINLTAFFSLLSGVKIIFVDISAGRKTKLKLPPPLNPPVVSGTVCEEGRSHHPDISIWTPNICNPFFHELKELFVKSLIWLCRNVVPVRWCNCSEVM